MNKSRNSREGKYVGWFNGFFVRNCKHNNLKTLNGVQALYTVALRGDTVKFAKMSSKALLWDGR